MAVMRKRPLDQAVLENAPEVIRRDFAKLRSPSVPPEKPFPRDVFNPMDIHWSAVGDPTPRH